MRSYQKVRSRYQLSSRTALNYLHSDCVIISRADKIIMLSDCAYIKIFSRSDDRCWVRWFVSAKHNTHSENTEHISENTTHTVKTQHTYLKTQHTKCCVFRYVCCVVDVQEAESKNDSYNADTDADSESTLESDDYCSYSEYILDHFGMRRPTNWKESLEVYLRIIQFGNNSDVHIYCP